MSEGASKRERERGREGERGLTLGSVAGDDVVTDLEGGNTRPYRLHYRPSFVA